MTITEKNLAEKLAGIYGDINDYDWATVARTAAEVLGVELAPEPKPLPVEPGSAIIATEVRGMKGEWAAFLEPRGDWITSEGVNDYTWHLPKHITKWTPARLVPEGEPIDLGDVRVGDRVRVEQDNGDEVIVTVTAVASTYLWSELNNFAATTIRTVHLLHREGA